MLARKWRPRDFETLVGQQHVVRALTHALGTGRLHHAYLLTGTRGVGKTTIARILAKAINCDSGPTPKPCGQCSACTGIDSGRFVDYVEMDAASNRGVDEMTQLLENAIYAPASARYKVYVIDEVHMLSTHAFNAMLKTLEEPPPHVLFVLATTDPQKVPVTVLSRCLQFNLRNMTAQAIADHLARVLQAEQVPFEPGALGLLGRSAGGSMRDALSLLDQAIAFGGGRVEEAAVAEMLGAVDQAWIGQLLGALASGDGMQLIQLADRMAELSTPFDRVLEELARALHQIALRQAGVSADEASVAAMDLAHLASTFAPEDIQVFYQIVIHGARDLPLAPDPHAGFSMLLLRLLAFRPLEGVSSPGRPTLAGSGAADAPGRAQAATGPSASRPSDPAGLTASQALQALKSATAQKGDRLRGTRSAAEASALPVSSVPPVASPSATGASSSREEVATGPADVQGAGYAVRADAPAVTGSDGSPRAPTAQPIGPAPAVGESLDASPTQAVHTAGLLSPVNPAEHAGAFATSGSALAFDGDWPALARQLGTTGLIGQFMAQSELIGHDGDQLTVRVPIRPLADASTVTRVRERLSQHFGRPIRVQVEVGRIEGLTAARQDEQHRSEQIEATREALEADPFVKTLMADFGGRILPDSVSPKPGA